MRSGSITFANPAAFWLGATAVTAGVVLHLPMFFSAAGVDGVLRGMETSTGMAIGLALIVDRLSRRRPGRARERVLQQQEGGDRGSLAFRRHAPGVPGAGRRGRRPTPGIARSALIAAVTGALAISYFGIEPRKRRLEESTPEEIAAAVSAIP